MENERHIMNSFRMEMKEVESGLHSMQTATLDMFNILRDYFTQGRGSHDFSELLSDLRVQVKKNTRELEDKVIFSIASRQPVGIDLRFLLTALKISSYFNSISKWILKVFTKFDTIDPKIIKKCKDEIISIALISQEMISSAMSLLSRSVDEEDRINILKQTLEKDDIADDAYLKIKNTILKEDFEIEKADLIALVSAAKGLEKVADLSTSIAKNTYYIITGYRVKGDEIS